MELQNLHWEHLIVIVLLQQQQLLLAASGWEDCFTYSRVKNPDLNPMCLANLKVL